MHGRRWAALSLGPSGKGVFRTKSVKIERRN
nr:MAG TPA: hypothetical protein [Caudoviricetes sp.]